MNIPFIYLLTRPNYSGGSSDTCLVCMTGRAIPQDYRIAHKNMEQAKYCFNLPNNV